MGMRYRTFVISATVIIAAVLTMMVVFSAEAISALTSVNLAGILAATFAAVVGFAWFIKKH